MFGVHLKLHDNIVAIYHSGYTSGLCNHRTHDLCFCLQECSPMFENKLGTRVGLRTYILQIMYLQVGLYPAGLCEHLAIIKK